MTFRSNGMLIPKMTGRPTEYDVEILECHSRVAKAASVLVMQPCLKLFSISYNYP